MLPLYKTDKGKENPFANKETSTCKSDNKLLVSKKMKNKKWRNKNEETYHADKVKMKKNKFNYWRCINKIRRWKQVSNRKKKR